MTTPFMGRIGEHPSGLTFTNFRDEETCAICQQPGQDNPSGVISEGCTPFATSASNLPTRIYQEFARIFPFLRPRAHGEQTRHIFHVECLKTWLNRKHECPICREPIHPDAMLSTAQKLRNEMGRHPKIWGALGAVFVGAFANWAGRQLGMSLKDIKWLEYGSTAVAYGILSKRLKN